MVRSMPDRLVAPCLRLASRAAIARSSSCLRALAAPPTRLRSSGPKSGRALRIWVRAPALRPRSSVLTPGAGVHPPAESPSDAPAANPGLQGGRSLLESLLCDLRQLLKRRRVLHGEIGQNLPVDLDARFAQAVHQAVVRQRVQSRGRVDARDPKAAELDLLRPAIAVGVLRRALGRLLRGFPEFAAPAPVPLGELHDFVLALQPRNVAFDARHGISLRQQQALEAAVGMRHQRRLPQVPLPLRMLRGQDVALVGSVAAQLAGARQPDPLSQGALRFHLWHCYLISVRGPLTYSGPRASVPVRSSRCPSVPVRHDPALRDPARCAPSAARDTSSSPSPCCRPPGTPARGNKVKVTMMYRGRQMAHI